MKKIIACLFVMMSLNAKTIDFWDKNFYMLERENDKWCLNGDISGFGLKFNKRLKKIIFNYVMEVVVFKIVDIQSQDNNLSAKVIPIFHNCNEIGVEKCFNEPINKSDIYSQYPSTLKVEFLQEHLISINNGDRFYTDTPKQYKLCKSQIQYPEE